MSKHEGFVPFRSYSNDLYGTVLLAHNIAWEFEYRRVGTLHLMEAVIRFKPAHSQAAKILLTHQVSDAHLRREISRRKPIKKKKVAAHKYATGKDEPPRQRRLPYQPETQDVLRLAESIRKEHNHKYVETEHLILAFAQHQNNQAMAFLRKCGQTEDVLQQDTLNTFRARGVQFESPL